MSLPVNILLIAALLLLTIPAVISCIYLLLLTLLSARPRQPERSFSPIRFDIIVPAHNEALVIRRCLASLSRIDWPADRFRLWVVADNCSDNTADLAKTAGARVLIRRDNLRRGKGYALDFAFEASQALGWADAVVVVDADTSVSPNLLEAFAARIDNGADAIQAYYGVLNPWASWRTRLLTIAHGSFHILRSQARERLGLSCGLRGNGWCVTHRLLSQVPCRAFSETEDLEYGLDLGIAGIRVHYADDAHANAEMFTGEQRANPQRRRWERGRFQLMRERTIPMLVHAIKRRDAVCLDLVFDLLVMPLTTVVLNVGVLLLLAVIAAGAHPLDSIWVWMGLGCSAALVAYVLRGWQLSGLGLRALPDLLCAPLFIIWKLMLPLRESRLGCMMRIRGRPS